MEHTRPICRDVSRLEIRVEVEREMRAAFALHLQGMIEDHEPSPSGDNIAEYIEVSLPNQVAG